MTYIKLHIASVLPLHKVTLRGVVLCVKKKKKKKKKPPPPPPRGGLFVFPHPWRLSKKKLYYLKKGLLIKLDFITL